MPLGCLRWGSATQGAVSDAATFCVNVLAEATRASGSPRATAAMSATFVSPANPAR